MINVCIFDGRLTRDPERVETKAGKIIARFSMAFDGYNKKSNFVDCTAFGKTADFILSYVKKGDFAVVQGTLDYQAWESEGKKRSKIAVIVDRISSPKTKSKDDESAPFTSQPEKKIEKESESFFDEDVYDVEADEDDEVPF